MLFIASAYGPVSADQAFSMISKVARPIPSGPEITVQRLFEVGNGQQVGPRLTGERLGDRVAGDTTLTRQLSDGPVPLVERSLEPGGHGLGDPRPVVLLHDGLRPRTAGSVRARQTGGKIVLVRVTEILYFRISPRLRELLDIPEYDDHDQGFEAAYAVVRRLFHAMKDAMNPSPLPPNGHLSAARPTN